MIKKVFFFKQEYYLKTLKINLKPSTLVGSLKECPIAVNGVFIRQMYQVIGITKNLTRGIWQLYLY